MLEIVFNESVFGSMEQAAINATHRKPENLFCFPLPLDRGDIHLKMRRPLFYLGIFFLAAAAVKGIYLIVMIWRNNRNG